MLHGLEVQHAQLMQNVKEKKAALHPIRRVPAELWADVFTRWADEEEYDRIERLDTHPTDTRLPASLIAASVSSFWRKTALSTPTLVYLINVRFMDLTEFLVEVHINTRPAIVRHKSTYLRMG
ncbi:hypothetical protein FRC19_004309 [Serendipita sp. 401]|nr:hypothetical protein FRC19_004309 [Serendipita sp. 401]